MKKIGALILAVGLVFGFAGCKTSTEELTLTKIEITAQPSKTEYLVGEELDTTGLEVTATYSDESTQVVTGWTTSGYDKTKTGEQTVTVSYTEEVTAQTSYTVTVKDIEITKIEVTTAPTKTKYYVGDSIELAGLKITATYTDGTTADVTDKVTTSGFDSSEAAESQTVTVTYEGKTVTFTVTIIGVKEIKITKAATSNKVYQYQKLDTTGLEVTVVYADNTTKVLEAGKYKVECNSDDTSTTIATVKHYDKTITYGVEVIQLNGINIDTNPDKMEYHIGEELDLTGIVLTLYYNDGTTPEFSDLNEITATGFDSSVLKDDQKVTVYYKEKPVFMYVDIVFNWYETPEQLPAGTNGTYGTEGTYVLFGVWPQDVVPEADVAGLALDETAATTIERGYLKYVKGSDGNYYVKCAENAFESGYKYKKDDSDVKQGGTTSRWFKVMPIKWRVVDTAYDVDGTNGNSTAKLLVAENILTANVPYYDDEELKRSVDDKIVFFNNYMHSQIRAFLNGLTYTGNDTYNFSNVEKSQWDNKGFLQTAFTSEAIDKIITTKVDNSKEQMSYDGTNDMDEDYACGPTDDKIFLLSEKEVVKYSKNAYSSSDNSRIRVTTDFAKANYAEQCSYDGTGGGWWLRSPSCSDLNYAFFVIYNGEAHCYVNVYFTHFGVVPALSISF